MLWEEDALHRFDEILNFKVTTNKCQPVVQSPCAYLCLQLSAKPQSASHCVGRVSPQSGESFGKSENKLCRVSPHSLGNLSLVWGVCDSSHDVSLSTTPSFAVSTLWKMSAGDDIISGPQAMWRRRDLTPESSQAHGRLEWSCVPLSSRPHAVHWCPYTACRHSARPYSLFCIL